ncbi:putative 4-hydroxybenzoate polyprenyltransferase [bacterium]|jgi:4-hydroxybenzoate polyprenyltransferase|nr:putative 4-hydroxybenzoate polyprenyltransferase [bacterium]
MNRLATFLESIKFSHTIFALPFALLSASLASVREGGFRLLDGVGILLCMVFARTAAMGFNRWADRDVDAKNPRTAIRAIPSGQLSASFVAGVVLVSSVGFVASTLLFWWQGNRWPFYLSMPVLGFLLGYSYTKRFTAMAHVWLGVALAMSPVAAWIAVRGNVESAPLLLALAVALWVTGFDIIYACQDLQVDRELGLRSIPAWLGMDRAMWVARFCHLGMVAVLFAFWRVTPELARFFPSGLVGLAGLLLYEHWLVRGRDLSRVNLAFLNVNGVISVGLFVLTLCDLFLPRM